MNAYAAYTEAMMKAGIIVGGERLRPTASATVVRAANGKTEVLNGPYAETKEQLGGHEPSRCTMCGTSANRHLENVGH